MNEIRNIYEDAVLGKNDKDSFLEDLKRGIVFVTEDADYFYIKCKPAFLYDERVYALDKKEKTIWSTNGVDYRFRIRDHTTPVDPPYDFIKAWVA